MAKSVDKIIEGGAKTALRWKEELPSVLTSCGRAFNYSIDKTGDAVWAGVFEKDRPNEAARFKICADEDEAREFCKLIEGAGKLPLCMGRNAASEAAGADVAGVETITLPEYGEKLEDVSGSGRMPKSASAPDAATVQAVADWLMAGDLAGYDHGRAMEEYGNRYWQIVKDALEYDLYDAVIAKLEADGIEGEWKEGARKSAQDADLGALSEDELKKRAIRDNMRAENDAIMMYSAYIDLLPEGDAVRSGLEDIRDEEKAHVGELHRLLVDLDPSEAEAFDEGMAEVGGDDEKEEEMDQGKAASRRMASQAAALAKIANRASDLARDIANYLEGEYFESEDDVRAFVDDEIDSSLIYTQDVFDYVREYVSDGEIQERLTPMFYEQLSEDVYSALGNLEDYVSGDVEEGRSASRKTMARRKASRLRRKHGDWRGSARLAAAKTADSYSREYPGGDGTLFYRYNYDTGMVEALLPEDSEQHLLDIFGGRLVDETGVERGDWEESPENVISMIEDRTNEELYFGVRDVMREFGKKASADLAPQVSYHDEQRPFHAYYEGQTKDKKATIGVVQQQIGSRPQLIVVSENGQVHDFGLMPSMDYAMRQASRFEGMGYVEIAAASAAGIA